MTSWNYVHVGNLFLWITFVRKCALPHQVIDLLVLLILHSTNANQSRRGAERLLKVKVRTGLIQEALLQRTFRDYAQVGGTVCGHTSLNINAVVHSTFYFLYWCINSLSYEQYVVLMNNDTLGHARVLHLHPGPGSESVALPRPLCGAFWWTHVPTLIHRFWLLLPAGGFEIHFLKCAQASLSVVLLYARAISFLFCIMFTGGGGLFSDPCVQWCRWGGGHGSGATLRPGHRKALRDGSVCRLCQGKEVIHVSDTVAANQTTLIIFWKEFWTQ